LAAPYYSEDSSMAESILSRASGRRAVPGDIVVARLSLVYMHDGTFGLARRVMMEAPRLDGVFDPSRVALFIDHAAPAPNLAAAMVHREMRRWARERGVRLYDVGSGISHQVVVDEGLAGPWDVVVGADSHTVTLGGVAAFATGVGSTDAAVAAATGRLWFRVPEPLLVRLEGRLPRGVTGKDLALHIVGELGGDGAIYRALEFWGPGLRVLSVDQRLTVANMSVEAGAKAAVFPSDGLLKAWFLSEHGREVPRLEPGPRAWYPDELPVELDGLEPLVAAPPRVDNVAPVSEYEGVEVDQVFLGSCTNGRVEDYVEAARILSRHPVAGGVRCIAVPASRKVYLRLQELGVINVLAEAGCVVAYGTCGPCIGAHLGILAEGEVAVSTSNRNMPGRMGHRSAKVFLASPLTAAAAAATGRITDPRSLLPGPVAGEGRWVAA